MITPTVAVEKVFTSKSCQVLINFLGAKSTIWAGLTGGYVRLCQFFLDLSSHPHVNQVVESEMRPLSNYILSKYPSLVCIKYGALKTRPNCPSQYEGHDHCLHLDYKSFHNDHLPKQRPVLVIMALNEFECIYLPVLTMKRKDLVNTPVPAGHSILFTNASLHSAGANNTDQKNLVVCVHSK